MLKNYLFSPFCSTPFLYSNPIFLFFQRHILLFLFFFLVSRPFFFFSFLPAFFFFSFGLLPFIFQPKILFFQPKRFSAPKHFFQPKTFLLQSKTFFSSAQNVFFFLFQFSHSSLLLFSALFFSGSALSFLFQHLLFFFYLAPFIQDPMFSLAASHLFYLNKSLFYSNLEYNLNNRNQV